MPTQKQFLDNTGLTQLLNELGQYLKGKQDKLTFDTTPTTNSTNPVTSGGVKTALDEKQATLVSGTNIKSINNASILGSGNIDLKPTDFLIIVTQSGSSIVADKTYEQITTAFNAGRNLIVKKGDDVFHISHENGREFVFVSEGKMGNQLRYKLTLTSQGEWVYLFESIDATEISIVNDDTHGRWYNGDQVEEALVALSDAIDDLGTPNEIESITTTESQASGGNNTVTIVETNGTSHAFNVKNGKDGADGVSLGEVALVQTTGDSEESVMSQKAVTEYGRKVTAEDLEGTSELVKSKMGEAGIIINKRTLNGHIYNDSNYCITSLLPIQYGHFYLIYYRSVPNGKHCGYRIVDDDGTTQKNAWYFNTGGQISVFINSSSYTKLQATFAMRLIAYCYILDCTDNTYLFRGDSFVDALCDGLLDVSTFTNDIVVQGIGNSTTKVMSQKSVSDLLKGNIGWTFSLNHYWTRGMGVSRSEFTYNLSEKPVIDIVSFNVYSGNGTTNGFFFFSPIVTSSYEVQSEFIGFDFSTWQIKLVIKRNNTVLLNQNIWSNSNANSGSISGVRFDFRRKKAIMKKRACQTGEITTVEVDLSSYDLDLGKSYLYTGFGGPNPSRGIYVGYNSYRYLDFDDYFNLSVSLGQPNPISDYTLLSNYYGDNLGGFSGFANITATKTGDNHYSIDLNSSSYISFGANYTPIQYLTNGISMTNGNSEWVFKIKATGDDVLMKAGSYVTYRDVWNVTDDEENIASSGEYTLVDGKEYEIRLRYQNNANSRYFMQLKGTATVELYDCRICGIMNTWIVPLNYDGYRIKGSIPFLYSYPANVALIPSFVHSNSVQNAYISGQVRINTSNNIYMTVFDANQKKFVEKQINNS